MRKFMSRRAAPTLEEITSDRIVIRIPLWLRLWPGFWKHMVNRLLELESSLPAERQLSVTTRGRRITFTRPGSEESEHEVTWL